MIGIEVRSPGSTGVPPEITKWGGQSFDAIYSTDATLRERIRVPKAPATIAVVGGRVTHIWQGIYINDRRVNLERYFQVSLPERTF